MSGAEALSPSPSSNWVHLAGLGEIIEKNKEWPNEVLVIINNLVHLSCFAECL